MIDDATRAETRGSERRWGTAAVLLAAVLAGGIVVVGGTSTSASAPAAAPAGVSTSTAGGYDGTRETAPAPSHPDADLDPGDSPS